MGLDQPSRWRQADTRVAVSYSPSRISFFTTQTPGCCGEKELLKFEAFTLVQHDAVILLDVDSLVLKSLDEAIDLLLDGTVPPASSGINSDPASHIMHYSPDDRRSTIPDDVWILYTPDYAMVDPSQDLKPAQGGFAIFKPNRTIYEQIMDIVREGKIEAEYGWGTPELNTDMFYGVKTFQGLLPYYFQLVRAEARNKPAVCIPLSS
jgi:hypothetical protein